ncbi:MAG TPA: hypothetical protein VGM17_19025 [Rhizomicrobium sp.]
MADETDEGLSAQGGDALAAQIALDAGKHSAEAREYLKKQSRIADLQIDTLQKKDEFELSHLRFRRFTDWTRFALEVAGFLVVLLVVSALGAMVWDAVHDSDLVFEAFSVPPDVAQTGMTGAVLANRVLDSFERMQAEPGVTQGAASGRRDSSNETRVEIPDTGISLGELARYLRGWLGNEVHVTGDLVHSGKRFALTVRYGSEPGVTGQGAAGNLDTLVQTSAEHVFAAARPYRFADYLVHKQRYAEAAQLIPPLTQQGTPDDRALAYAAWAELEFYGNGDMRAELDKGREAVRLNPRNPLTRFWLGAAEGNLGHDEANWANFGEGLRLADEGGTGMTGELTAALIPAFRGYRDETEGDYLQAIRDYEQARPSDVWISNLQNEVSDVAAAHDNAGARALVRFIPVKRKRDGKPNADVPLAQFEVAFNAGDWSAAVQAGAVTDKTYVALAAPQWARRNLFWPLWACAMAMNGDVAGAESLIAKTATDCDVCMRMRGRIAAHKHDWASATRDFAAVSARSPHIPFADTDWGEMLLRKGDIDGAIAKFTAANQKGPHFTDPLEMWGEALIAKNRSDLALAKFEEANKYAPNWGRLHLKWGEALLWTGDKTGARKQFSIARTLDLTASEKSQLARMTHG